MTRKASKIKNEVFFECPQGVDPEERKMLLHKIIDGQASEIEEKQFFTTLENCDHCKCKDLCDQHMEIKNLLKEKIINKPLPEGLIDDIKSKILKS